MSNRLLVAYASKYGSTQEVAEAIARTLTECGAMVDLRPLREVRKIEEYTAVVMGAPLYMFRWHKDAHGFLSHHRAALSKPPQTLPVAVFALGPISDRPEDWQEVRFEVNKELAKHPWFTPAATMIVGGKFDPTHLRLPWSLLPALKQTPPTDLRDWSAIRAWAEEFAGRFNG